MRPVHIADLDMVTRYLLSLPAQDHAQAAARIVARADTADRYRKRLGRVHPAFGTGTLASAIPGTVVMPRPAHYDIAGLQALGEIQCALISYRIR